MSLYTVQCVLWSVLGLEAGALIGMVGRTR